MKKADIALVGIGGYGKLYLEHILHGNDERLNTVGFVEPFPESCQYIDEIKSKNLPIYNTLAELYVHASPSLTIISSPIHCHTAQMICALEHGSHVLCEKPLCADAADIPLLLEAEKKSGKNVYIGYQWSYSKAINQLKNDISAGKLGKCLSMKTVVLWPRNKAYFGRGSGWAGKMHLEDGTPVFDSVANNATAHYLFNMLYILGDKKEAAYAKVEECELLRVNDIENFDAIKLKADINGTKATYIAAHPVSASVGPVFEYRFENATVYFSAKTTDRDKALMPAQYTEYGKIVAIFKNGEKTVYGDPYDHKLDKLNAAIEDTLSGTADTLYCGISAAAAHTALISDIQNGFKINCVDKSRIKTEKDVVYAEGLFEELTEAYINA